MRARIVLGCAQGTNNAEVASTLHISAATVCKRERIGVLTLIEDVLGRYREQLVGRRVDISNIASQLHFYGDRSILSAAFQQFIDNASRYSTVGSLVSVTAKDELGEIVIAIHNEGPAIAPVDRERVFKRFYRAVESRHQSAGTGLGLPITHLRLLQAVWGPEYMEASWNTFGHSSGSFAGRSKMTQLNPLMC